MSNPRSKTPSSAQDRAISGSPALALPPGNKPGSPLTLEKIIVEARNEVPYLGVMKPVPERSYQLAGLVA